MKKRIGLIITLVVIALIIFAVMLVITEFTGNPITKLVVKNKADKYLKQNYSELDFKTEKPVYNFKFECYYVNCFIENSKDKHFSITFGKNGRLLRDDYENITKGYNTVNRLSDQFNEYVEEIIRKNLPYDYYILGCDARVIKDNAFTIDQEFNPNDFINLTDNEIEINIADYINTDINEMNWKNVIDKLTELDKLLQDNGILATRISLMLESKDEKSHDMLGAHDITREMIDSDNLEEQLMEKYLVDGVISKLMFSKASVAAPEDTNMMYEFEPMLMKWDDYNFNTFVDFKPYLTYVDNQNWDRAQQIIELKNEGNYIEDSEELNISRLDYFDYHELGTVLQIEMEYGDAPDKCTVTDYILKNDGTLKYGEKTAMESELSFVDGKATYTIEKHMAALLSSSTYDYNKGNTIRGLRLSCEFGENKVDYIYVFRTDAVED